MRQSSPQFEIPQKALPEILWLFQHQDMVWLSPKQASPMLSNVEWHVMALPFPFPKVSVTPGASHNKVTGLNMLKIE